MWEDLETIFPPFGIITSKIMSECHFYKKKITSSAHPTTAAMVTPESYTQSDVMSNKLHLSQQLSLQEDSIIHKKEGVGGGRQVMLSFSFLTENS